MKNFLIAFMLISLFTCFSLTIKLNSKNKNKKNETNSSITYKTIASNYKSHVKKEETSQPSLSSKLYYQLESKKLDNYFSNLRNRNMNHIEDKDKEDNNRNSNKNLILNQISQSFENQAKNVQNTNNINNNLNTNLSSNLNKNDESEMINQQLNSVVNSICNSKLSLLQSLNNINSEAKAMIIKTEKIKSSKQLSQKIVDCTRIVNELNTLKSEVMKINLISDTLKQASCENNIEEISLLISKTDGNLNSAFEVIEGLVQKNSELKQIKLVVLS